MKDTITFDFTFVVDDHEDEAKTILRREIVNIVADNVVPRAGITPEDIDSWEAELGPAKMVSGQEGYTYDVFVTVKLKEEMEVGEIGDIKTRYGGA